LPELVAKGEYFSLVLICLDDVEEFFGYLFDGAVLPPYVVTCSLKYRLAAFSGFFVDVFSSFALISSSHLSLLSL
jgi:hypothetical protein